MSSWLSILVITNASVGLATFFLMSGKPISINLKFGKNILWLIPLLGTLAVYAGLAVLMFTWGQSIFDRDVWFSHGDDKAAEFRSMVLAFGALAATPVALLTLSNSIWRSQIMKGNEQVAFASHERELKRLDAETFADAAQKLGAERVEQQLGAVFALQQLSSSAGFDTQRQVRKTLAAYLRSRSQEYFKALNEYEGNAFPKADEAFRAAVDVVFSEISLQEGDTLWLEGIYLVDHTFKYKVRNVNITRSLLYAVTFSYGAEGCFFSNLKSDCWITFSDSISLVHIARSKLSSLFFHSADLYQCKFWECNIKHMYLHEFDGFFDCEFINICIGSMDIEQCPELKIEHWPEMQFLEDGEIDFPSSWRDDHKTSFRSRFEYLPEFPPLRTLDDIWDNLTSADIG